MVSGGEPGESKELKKKKTRSISGVPPRRSWGGMGGEGLGGGGKRGRSKGAGRHCGGKTAAGAVLLRGTKKR